MKRSSFHSLSNRSRGVALIIVLAMLVLIAGLIVGFMRRMGTERITSAAYTEANRNGQLADHAVNLVQAQVSQATSSKLAWASQPGMVRTFKADGSLDQAYKLYSDTTLIGQASASDALTAMADWSDQPALFVDLNAPIFRTPDGGTAPEPVYPILDPRAATVGVQGFEIGSDAPGTTATQPAPMPVRWLYILEDGTTVAPSGTSGDVATIPGASESNPIVGRIAFWSDDESAKLNINTASHGSFWDLPRAFSVEERDRMARYQPTLREFQRYPGHPATTSLWPALGHLFTDENGFIDFILGEENSTTPGANPRVRQGGSLSGSRAASAPISLLSPPPRLYTSVDELLFSPARGQQAPLDRASLEAARFFLTARSNAPEINLFNLPRMAIWPINSDSKTPSTLDELIAFCSTINTVPYYFARTNANSPTADVNIPPSGTGQRNLNLHSYITKLLKSPFPGFGNNSFETKYTGNEVDQITTMIFDYIRSSNTYSSALGATPFTGLTPTSNPLTNGTRVGQVTPLKIGNTKGIGRIPVLSKAILHFYIDGFTDSDGNTVSASNFPSGAIPVYSTGLNGPASYKAVNDFFTNAGHGKEVTPHIRAVVYFDAFDPMYGYIFPRYNFTIDVAFSGTWTVNSASLGFPSGTSSLPINYDHLQLYDAKSHQLASVWMGQFLGGNLRPLWIMQNFSYLRGHTANTVINNAGYPLVSASLPVLPAVILEDPVPSGSSLVALPDPATPATLNFSGGTVTATVKVDGETIQSYNFDFPAFNKPAPIYPPRNYHSESTIDAQIASVVKQLAVSMDFRNRLSQQQQIHRIANPGSSNASYNYADYSLLQPFDTIVSLEPTYGDKRLLSGKSTLTSGTTPSGSVSFVPHSTYTTNTERHSVDFRTEPFGTDRYRRAIAEGFAPGRILPVNYGANAMPDIPRQYHGGVPTQGGFPPDFDNGTMHQVDDAYVNRADEGSAFDLLDESATTSKNDRHFAWYWDLPSRTTSTGGYYFNSPTFYSPNKQMASAGIFGSIPTGVVRNRAWQTLLFRPDPGGHPGAQSGMPPDHLLLDLFWMPVVEPYAISEPFSSNGKVNMNYQIMPFSYIHRSTALMGVLHSQELLSIQNSEAGKGAVSSTTNYSLTASKKGDEYKMFNEGTASDISTINYRRRLNLSRTNGTLRAFEDRFAADRLFISETEICSLPLVPIGANWSANFEQDYWGSRRLTGDNSREAPYAHLLPRLTTRSNTYTVHYWVQSLRKPRGSRQNEWNPATDRVVSELRGSRTIERYVDPARTDIPNYTTATDPLSLASLETFYRWRTLANREFRP